MRIRIGERPDHGFDQPLGLLSDCHRRIEYFLQVLVLIAERAAARTVTAGERGDLTSALTYFAQAARIHTADEEASLFPRLRASTDPEARRALDLVERLEQDHDRADGHHTVVDTLVRRWLAVGTLDTTAHAELRDRLAALASIYESHIGIEDRELFPAASRVLPPGEIRAIGQEMAARRAKP